ncbi:MAG: phosphoribosylformimino-5-aminoimidazole carboxamide ribotide isomerase [Eubacterium sp.]|nr:phosphoribosylformimino-5-aminoimidazole carboxamide ribotide isomerase [Eubacterium sp.]
MRFRPCIDIHNGSVKQIVGGSLSDLDVGETNFVASEGGAFYGRLYRELELPGGHIILLNPAGTTEYEADMETAREALAEYPGGLMIGGGVTSENAAHFLDMGASHVIVTSYVFRNGRVDWKRLERLVREVGTEHLVLDLSCRRTEQGYCIATDRWQKLTEVYITPETLDLLKESCAEYLIHAVDAEGKRRGIEEPLAKLLGDWGKIPVTYAGGVGSFRDLDILREAGSGRLDVTIGSALSIFGGDMELAEVIRYTVSNE